jgi:hypothetical protein
MRLHLNRTVSYLAFGLMAALPANAMFKKAKAAASSVVRAIPGLPGDVRKVASAATGDKESRERLRANWASAKAKLARLLHEEGGVEEPAGGGAGSAGGGAASDPTREEMEDVMRMIEELEDARAMRRAMVAPPVELPQLRNDGFDDGDLETAIAASLEANHFERIARASAASLDPEIETSAPRFVHPDDLPCPTRNVTPQDLDPTDRAY